MIIYVEEYFHKLTLSKLGYRFDPDDLTIADVEAFHIIDSTIKKHENDQMKRMKAKRKRNGR